MTVRSGFNFYTSPGPQSLADNATAPIRALTLDSGLALTMAGSATLAALTVLQFWREGFEEKEELKIEFNTSESLE